MPNYNISVVVDPSGAGRGIEVVENRLEGVKRKASSTETAIQRAFDFSAAGAVTQVGMVDKALDGVASSATSAANAVERGMSRAGAAAQRAGGRIVQSNAQVRASQIQLGAQFNDFSTQILSGTSAITAFAQQSGQAAFALQGMNGWLGTAGRFLAGPWGTALIIGTTLFGAMVTKWWEGGEALEKATEELKEDARETAITAQAKKVFAETLDGVTDALRRNAQALDQLEDRQKTAARRALEDALAAKIRLENIRAESAALMNQTKIQLELNRARMIGPETKGRVDPAQTAYNEAQDKLAGIATSLAETDAAIYKADEQITKALSHRVVELADSDKVEQIKRRYDGLIETARRRAVAEGTVSTELDKQVKTLAALRDAEVKTEQARTRTTSDGVSRFRSREQAIGVAGRELQQGGLRVGENQQFGGVKVNHPGMGNAAHGAYAIDVNVGAGVTEANVPDLKDRFDELARRYQSRGFEVVWNKQFYPAFGDGPSKGAKGHTDHLHIQAPRTIVGRPTQSSVEAAAIADFRRVQQEQQRLAREGEAQKDFVQGVVDQASARGRPGVENSAQAQIDRTLADFERRFNRVANDNEKGRITKALTGAVARETAAHFDQAYVKPLERLRKLQGTTGQDREILNKQLEESERLGRALTPIEAQKIANSVKYGDALQRQSSILEGTRTPLQDYADQIEALNELLRRGEINQTSFNARVSDLGATARGLVADMPGKDPLSGRSYGDIAAQAEEDARFARELDAYQNNRAQLLAMGVNYDALVEAAHRRHVDNMNAIDQARKNAALSTMSQLFGNLATLQGAKSKELQAIGKAAAITQATIDAYLAINKALSDPTIPSTPMRIALSMSIGVAALANVAKIAGLKDGGLVTGPGTSRSDSIPAYLSNGEFVVNAQATRSNRALLEAINSGRRPRSVANDNPAPVGETFVVNVGDVIVQGGGGDGKEVGRNVKAAIVSIVRSEIKVQKRAGGSLTRGAQSVMSGV